VRHNVNVERGNEEPNNAQLNDVYNNVWMDGTVGEGALKLRLTRRQTINVDGEINVAVNDNILSNADSNNEQWMVMQDKENNPMIKN
jgi:hypothetical protein